MKSTQHWKCHKCGISNSILILGLTQVQIIYKIVEQHNFESKNCGTISMILLEDDEPKTNKTMDAKKCYWCGLDIGNGNFETRIGRIQYYCSLVHIRRWAGFKSSLDKDGIENIKIFVCGKYIGQLKDFKIE